MTDRRAETAVDVTFPDVITAEEVAQLYRASRSTVYARHRDGSIPGGRKVGRRLLRFHRDTILDWLGICPPPRGSAFPDVLNIDDLARLLRLNLHTLYELRKSGDLVLPAEAVVLLKPPRFSRRGVLDWLRGNSPALHCSEVSQ